MHWLLQNARQLELCHLISICICISASYLLSLMMISSLPLFYSTTRVNILLERQQVIFGPRLILGYHPTTMPKYVIKWMIRTSSSCLQNEFFGYKEIHTVFHSFIEENKSNIETYVNQNPLFFGYLLVILIRMRLSRSSTKTKMIILLKSIPEPIYLQGNESPRHIPRV